MFKQILFWVAAIAVLLLGEIAVTSIAISIFLIQEWVIANRDIISFIFAISFIPIIIITSTLWKRYAKDHPTV